MLAAERLVSLVRKRIHHRDTQSQRRLKAEEDTAAANECGKNVANICRLIARRKKLCDSVSLW
jgi:hypothetical protein